MSEQLFDELAAGLDQSVERGDLPNPGAKPSEKGTPNDTDSHSYIWALRTRLADLGYLGENTGNRSSVSTDPAFMHAVKRFQRDVGELQDRWAGPVTWRVLQCLVSFEDMQEPRNWNLKVPLHESPAVARAAWLRLWVMGFFVDGRNARDADWKKSKLRFNATIEAGAIAGSDAFRSAFARFWEFARRLCLLAAELPAVPQLNHECLAVLFNYDAIVRKLASAGKPGSSKTLLRDFHEQIDDFREQVEAIARIELWLLGYDCAPGPPRMGKKRRIGAREVGAVPTQLSVVTGEFWHDFSNRPDGVPPDRISPALFAEFGRLLDEKEVEARDADQVVRKVNEILAQEKERDTEEFFFVKVFRNLASSIWDGVKRLAKFLWRVIRGAVSAVTNLARNLARYIASEAREFFYIVVRAVDAVQGGVDYLRNSIHPKKLPTSVVFSRRAGFDHAMLVDSSAARVTDTPAFTSYRHQARCYCAGCVVLGELVGMLGSVARLATGALAGPLLWLRTLLALGRFRAGIERVKEALALLKDEKNYSVSGTAAGALMLTDVA